MPNDNGKNPPPPESLHFERSQVACQRCHKIFEHLIFEEIDDLKQLRLGDGLVLHLKMTCLHCGQIFNWNVREMEIEKMAITYSELAAAIKGYNPE